jgi:hypothetical protein
MPKLKLSRGFFRTGRGTLANIYDRILIVIKILGLKQIRILWDINAADDLPAKTACDF